MRLLLDANLSPALVQPLTHAGYDVTHVADIGLLTASDDAILQIAADDNYVVITADSDFPMMLATRRASKPSAVLLRHVTELPRHHHADLLIANLPTIADDLQRGAIASLSPTRLAVRRLPIG